MVLIAAGFFAGYEIRDKFFTKPAYRPAQMRLTGYNFVKPLLLCDSNTERILPELKPLQISLNNFINDQETAKNVDAVSIYFQDLKTGGIVDINPDEKFIPASTGKVPMMMDFLRIAESDPSILNQTVTCNDATDYNVNQEMKPKYFVKYGQTYTVENLVEKMIENSDNNALYQLINFIDPETLNQLYADLHVPLLTPDNYTQTTDFMTTKDNSYFFRVLYNGTYLDNELSDKALDILSQSDYKNGIVAGVPNNISVAHKFGLYTTKNNGVVVKRELHDCGIVYQPKDNYLLCVMTKSSADKISSIENVIKNISSIVYNQVDSYSK